jgi:UDP-N-acetylmuramoyl-tripeptide--D-alanyl-D-alanine ligase
MIDSTLAKAAAAMQGQLLGNNTGFRGVSTDSRTIGAGELFVALQGPNFDGTEFIAAAASRNAIAAVVTRPVEAAVPTIIVDDTQRALGRLAADWRRQMPARVVGITGSNGKTTLKEMVANCLSLAAKTLATAGNLNNEIGVPLMLLRLAEQYRFAVIEMGANQAGEIAYLASLASPKIVAITNAAPAHLEGFGSLEGVAHAKGEILKHADRPDVAVLNADDQFYSYWRSLIPEATIVSFGFGTEATFRATDVYATEYGSAFTLHMPNGELQIALPLHGSHNVLHACAAAAIASALKIDEARIKQGLEAAQPVAGRLQPVRSASGDTLYDDSYNANPVSVVAAAKFLAAQPGDNWLVLGDMAELGNDAAALHRSVGTDLKKAGIRQLAATGDLCRHTVAAFGEGAYWFATHDELIEKLRAALHGNANVLVKGSRSMGMERVVDALRDRNHKQRSA